MRGPGLRKQLSVHGDKTILLRRFQLPTQSQHHSVTGYRYNKSCDPVWRPKWSMFAENPWRVVVSFNKPVMTSLSHSQSLAVGGGLEVPLFTDHGWERCANDCGRCEDCC